jgi:hypothetical protein
MMELLAESPDVSVAEWWLKTGMVYGLAFAALSLFVMICLYAFWKIVLHGVGILQLLREWLPNWFKTQVEVNRRTIIMCDTLTGTQREIVSQLGDVSTQLGGVSTQIADHRRECNAGLAQACKNLEPKK